MNKTPLFNRIQESLGIKNPHADSNLVARKFKAVSGGIRDACDDGAIVSTTLIGLVIAVAALMLGAGPIAVCAGLALPLLELANTAIENTVDLASGGAKSELAREAKDAGALMTSYGLVLAFLALAIGIFWKH